MTLPAPRLQLKWRRPTKRELARNSIGHVNDERWTCDYELVLPLGDGDIRRKKKSSELTVRLCRTFTSRSTGQPPDYAPFRDGAHAQWDSKALGNLPIFVICPDGTAKQQPAVTAGDAACRPVEPRREGA